MRVGIFYISRGEDAVDVAGAVACPLPGGGSVRIRISEVQADSLEDALDMAEPLPGESLMNTHELPAV